MSEQVGDNKDMKGIPTLLAKFFRKMTQIIDTNNVVIIFISQLMSTRNSKGAKYAEKGGWAIQYASSVWLNINWVQQWQPDPDSQAPAGQDVHVKIISSALGCPFLPCAIPLRFGHGFDVSRDIALMAENFGLIEKSGAWYQVPLFDNQKFQGIKNLCKFLDENKNKRNKLEKEVREIVLPDTKG
jgi:recombination protein RecA